MGACNEFPWCNHNLCRFFSHEIMCHVNLVSGQPSYVYTCIVTKYMSAHHKIPVIIQIFCNVVYVFTTEIYPYHLWFILVLCSFPLAEYCSMLILYRTAHATEPFGCYSILLKHHHFSATSANYWCANTNVQNALATFMHRFPS